MINEINVKSHPDYDNHERVFYFEDKSVKLRGYIAIHSTKLGPATGGTRLNKYKSKSEALKDALRLSRAMSYKCAISNLPYGGGKAVIIGNENLKNDNFFRAYSKIIDSFNGSYTTGTDVGITDADTFIMSQYTPFILKGSGGSHTTSQIAALGVYFSIKEAHKLILNKSNSKTTIAIKGIGKIGGELARLLILDNYNVIIADINKKNLLKISKEFPKIKVVNYKKIHKLDVDIYAPCAMGNEFSKNSIKNLNCKIIIGGANNQLTNNGIAFDLHKSNILYIPDYVVNSGGLIQIVDELDNTGYNTKRVLKRVRNIGKIVNNLILKSIKLNKAPLLIAENIAFKKLNYDKSKKRQRTKKST